MTIEVSNYRREIIGTLLFLVCAIFEGRCVEATPEDVSVCAIVQDPAQYNGHAVSVYGDFESDGIERVILSDRLCNKALTLQFVPTPSGYDELMKALRGGLPGTLDKVVKARFTGVFRWRSDKIPGFVLSVDEISQVSLDPDGRTPLREFQDEEAEAEKHLVNVCALTKNGMGYDGHTILVEGTYRLDIHKAILTDRACPGSQLILREDPGHTTLMAARSQLESVAKTNKEQSIEVVFRGIFRLVADPKCATPLCGRYELEIEELVTVHETRGKSDGLIR